MSDVLVVTGTGTGTGTGETVATAAGLGTPKLGGRWLGIAQGIA